MSDEYDVIVIGSGPAGLGAAIEAAHHGARVAVVEKERDVGGACVHRGTIPSKTLRETAVQLSRLRRSAIDVAVAVDEQTEVATLMRRLEEVTTGHVAYMSRQMERAGVDHIHGRGRFIDPETIRVERIRETPLELRARRFIIAVGSRPRRPPEIPIDHENVLDSDSVLSMIYLPASLTVLGGGVIASEWASIFTELGVRVTVIDRSERPLSFMDAELTDRFVTAFERSGGRYLPRRNIRSVAFDGVSRVVTELEDGERIESRKLLCALGRVANLGRLGIEALGVEKTKRGHLIVDEHCRTTQDHVYAVGDVIGFPALAATSMEQGRRAARHALAIEVGHTSTRIPVGIFTIPELSAVGLTEEAARAEYDDVVVGRARFDEVARGHISGAQDGLLKLVARASTGELLGVHIVGDGATELAGIGQMALAGSMPVTALVENIFNFPTLAEAYRIAALDVLHQQRVSVADAAE